MNLTQSILKKYVYYFDGKLFHKKERKNVLLPLGSELGYIHNGYKIMRLFHKKYGIHQLVYLYHKGFIPKLIDHRNGNTLDNRIENLREADKSKNAGNQKVIKKSKSGIKGVRIKNNKIYSIITYKGKRYFLGYFKTIIEAKNAYDKEAKKLFGEYARI